MLKRFKKGSAHGIAAGDNPLEGERRPGSLGGGKREGKPRYSERRSGDEVGRKQATKYTRGRE